MRDQIVNFKTAEIAKHKEFNILTMQSYNIVTNQLILDFPHVNEDNFGFSAPTQSQLQRWLRDEHRIQVIVDCFIEENDVGDDIEMYQVKVFYPKTWREKDEFVMSNFSVYEDVLELGLQEALKLIK